jgi:hypothetical protein
MQPSIRMSDRVGFLLQRYYAARQRPIGLGSNGGLFVDNVAIVGAASWPSHVSYLLTKPADARCGWPMRPTHDNSDRSDTRAEPRLALADKTKNVRLVRIHLSGARSWHGCSGPIGTSCGLPDNDFFDGLGACPRGHATTEAPTPGFQRRTVTEARLKNGLFFLWSNG